MASNSIKYSE